MAAALRDETHLIVHEHAWAEVWASVESFDEESGLDFFTEVRRFEVALIHRALEVSGNNQTRAARLLGLGTTTLNYKIKSYQMSTASE